jgi:hypothetical protein
MPVQFFLKHDSVLDLLNHYDTTTPGLHKGLVFSVDFELGMVQIGTPPITKPEYIATARVWGVEGPYKDPTGALSEIPGTGQIPCPHPPPCAIDLNGNIEIDKRISNVAITDCYPQGE